MPNKPDMDRAVTPDMEASRRSRESEFGAAPRAATTPMRARRDDEDQNRPRREGNEAADKPRAGEAGTPAETARGEDRAARTGETAKADRDGKTPEVPAAETAKAGAPDAGKRAAPGKPAKAARDSRPHKKPLVIQRVNPSDFPDFPESVSFDDEKEDSREDSPQMVRAIAVGMPILGLIGGGAFTFGLASLGAVGQFPFSFAVGLIAVLCMMAGVTVMTLNLMRQSNRIGRKTDELLSRYFEPEAAAVKTVQTLGDAIRREMEKLSGNLDALAGRVEGIEKRLQKQSDELVHAMDRLEQRAKATSQTLSDERERLEDTSRTLNDRTQSAAQSLDEQISAARQVMEQATGKLGEADRTLKEHIAALDETAQTTSAGAKEASGVLEKQAQLVSEISLSAVDAAKRATDRYQHQHRMLTEAIDKLTEEAGRMDRVFDTQRQSLRDIADATAKQSERIEDVLGKCARGLEETLDSAANRARSIGGIFTEQSESILAAGEDAAGAMTRAADTARLSADDAKRAIEEQIRASQLTLDEQLTRARAALGGLTDETAAALERQLETSRGALDALLSGLRGLVDSRLQQARGLFDAMIGEFDRTIVAQISALREHRDHDRRDWEAWRDRIGTALEGVRLQARDSLQLLNETATEVEQRLGSLPARVAGGSDELRRIIAEQVSALDALAASAQTSVATVEGLMSGLPDKISAGSEALTGKIAAQARAIEDMAAHARAQMGNLEQMFDRLPGHVDSQAAHIRTALEEQTRRIDDASALAARRAQDVTGLRKPDAPARTPAAAPAVSPPSAPPAAPQRPAAANGADAHGRGNGELSVQEILARREAGEEIPAARAPARHPDAPPPVQSRPDMPRPQPQRPATPDAAPPPVSRRGDAPDLPPRPPRHAEPSFPAEPPAAERAHDHADRQRLAQLKEERLARHAGRPPAAPPPEEAPGDIPSFLRRPSASGRNGQAPEPSGAGRTRVPAPGADGRPPRAEGTPSERPKPIFSKRFANFDEPAAPAGDAPPMAPDDPVSIRTGATNVQRPHPAAAARRAMMRDMPQDTQDDEAPFADAREPEAPEETGAPFVENPFTDFGPPPIPGATRQTARRPERKQQARDAVPGDASEETQAKSGRLGWSDILAAAERASHEDGVPEAENGLDPDAEKARTAAPEGPGLGTPELQGIAREIVAVLQTLSLDLRPIWRETIPPEVVRRFLKGDKRALTRRLPVMGGMETMTRIRRRYRSEPRFRANVDRFAQEFDVLVDQIHGLDAARAERYMVSQNGRLFILLKQVLSKS